MPIRLAFRLMPARSRHTLLVVTPYRLDLTVSALRRLATNVVDVLTPDGQYVHVFRGAHGPVLDVFPMNDTSVARNLAVVAGDVPIDVPKLLAALRPEQGMLYYYLLLARLEAHGEVGRPSVFAR